MSEDYEDGSDNNDFEGDGSDATSRVKVTALRPNERTPQVDRGAARQPCAPGHACSRSSNGNPAKLTRCRGAPGRFDLAGSGRALHVRPTPFTSPATHHITC